MHPVDAFLLCSALAYFCSLPLPKPCTRNVRPVWLERLGMLLCGTIIILNLVLNNPWVWLLMGLLWTFLSIASFLGYVLWNVLWEEAPSSAAQAAMWLWDLLIAVSCLVKF
jgi:hypothetical protein